MCIDSLCRDRVLTLAGSVDLAPRAVSFNLETHHFDLWSVPRLSAFRAREHGMRHWWREMHNLRSPNGDKDPHLHPHRAAHRHRRRCSYRSL